MHILWSLFELGRAECRVGREKDEYTKKYKAYGYRVVFVNCMDLERKVRRAFEVWR